MKNVFEPHARPIKSVSDICINGLYIHSEHIQYLYDEDNEMSFQRLVKFHPKKRTIIFHAVHIKMQQRGRVINKRKSFLLGQFEKEIPISEFLKTYHTVTFGNAYYQKTRIGKTVAVRATKQLIAEIEIVNMLSI